ncbi:MAG: hypothetical protein Q4Q53_05925, partial [Methanocorpusculum sp.]|nr:hypothetical protein [Methanocorpusculum sp.]
AKDTSVSAVETIVTKSNEETDTKPTNTTSIIPNPIGIIQEFVKLFLSLFNFDNYIIFGNNATAPAA